MQQVSVQSNVFFIPQECFADAMDRQIARHETLVIVPNK